MKGVIFDLDGVIISTDEQHYQGWKALADRLSIPFDRETNHRFRGVSRMACMDIIEELSGRSFTTEQKVKYATWKNEYYRNLLGELSPADLSSEVKDTLDALRAKGLKLAIGSSSRNAKFILERIGLADYFDAVSDGTNIRNSKPDPEVFLKAAEFLGLTPSECLVVEDAVAGAEAAKAGGMKSATVGDAALKNCGDYILNNFTALRELL